MIPNRPPVGPSLAKPIWDTRSSASTCNACGERRAPKGKTHKEAAAIRTAEAEKACEVLKARALFAGQIDGSTEVSATRYDAFFKLLDAEKPDVVFTHWPVDSHRDHRATSLLVYDAWLKSGKKFALFYFEVDAGAQTQLFKPTHYGDISQTEEPQEEERATVHTDAPRVLPEVPRSHEPLSRSGMWLQICRSFRASPSRRGGHATVIGSGGSRESRK